MDTSQIIPPSSSSLCKILLHFVDSEELDKEESQEVGRLILNEVKEVCTFYEPDEIKYVQSTRILKTDNSKEVYLVLNEAVLYSPNAPSIPVPAGSILILQNPVKVLPLEGEKLHLIFVNFSVKASQVKAVMNFDDIEILSIPDAYLKLAHDMKELCIVGNHDDTPISEATSKMITDAYDMEELYTEALEVGNLEELQEAVDVTACMIQLLIGLTFGLEKTILTTSSYLKSKGYHDYISLMKIVLTIKVDLSPVINIVNTDTFANIKVLSHLYDLHLKQQVNDTKLPTDITKELVILAKKYFQKEALVWLSTL